MTSSVPERIRRLAKVLKASSEDDYIYDPNHTKRPHYGGPWYKTERGWTTNKPDEMKPKKKEEKKPASLDERAEQATKSNSPNELRELSKDKESWVRMRVAKNPHAPEDVLEKLSKDNVWAVRMRVANNPAVTPKILENLSKDENQDVRELVAKNPKTPLDTLDNIINKELGTVRDAAIRNRNSRKPKEEPKKQEEKAKLPRSYKKRLEMAENSETSQDLLREIYQLTDSTEYAPLLASNYNTPEDILRELANMESRGIKRRVAENPSTPDDVLEDLINKELGAVRDAAIRNRNSRTPNPKPKEEPKKQEENTLEKPKQALTDEERQIANLEKLSRSTKKDNRAFVARHPLTPPKLLSKLSKDADRTVRANAARNKNLSEDDQYRLCHDDDTTVRQSLALSTGLTKKVRDVLMRDSDHQVKASLATNITLDRDTYFHLANNGNWMVRQNLAYNPRTPTDLVMALSKDANSNEVSKAAKEAFKWRKKTSAELNKIAKGGNEVNARYAKRVLRARALDRRAFCEKHLGDPETYRQAKGYKKAIGEKRGYGRSPEEVKRDFLNNMDASRYDSPEAFQKAKDHIQKMPVRDFDALLGTIFNKDEDEALEEN